MTTNNSNIIYWGCTSKNIYNYIRSLYPTPCAMTYLDNKIIKIYFATYIIESHEFDSINNPIYQTDEKTFLRYATLDGWIYINEIEMHGIGKMRIGLFLEKYYIN